MAVNLEKENTPGKYVQNGRSDYCTKFSQLNTTDFFDLDQVSREFRLCKVLGSQQD